MTLAYIRLVLDANQGLSLDIIETPRREKLCVAYLLEHSQQRPRDETGLRAWPWLPSTTRTPHLSTAQGHPTPSVGNAPLPRSATTPMAPSHLGAHLQGPAIRNPRDRTRPQWPQAIFGHTSRADDSDRPPPRTRAPPGYAVSHGKRRRVEKMFDRFRDVNDEDGLH